MGTLYMFRHGLTEGNEKRLYYGITDLSLSENGINSILIRKNRNMYPDSNGYKIISSGLSRTSQTASLIYGNTEIIKDSRLNEINFGIFEMKSYDELKDQKEYIEWISGNNWENICPGGESGKIMFDRAKTALNEYKLGNYIIFTHGGIISSFMLECFPNDKVHEHFYSWQPKPCEGYKINFDDNGRPVSYAEIKMDNYQDN